ncbi:MAG: hypothetical protein CSA09_01900 [Candidatus Contendobacter odensis]|uniref:Urease accessory protein UreH-like transmembrane domain-containing protein n=1 Tax=Candidatus Contendibacter odensensis TaxID=1400860 RepID=A0A2G6PGD7_9GAMM|nr:MAG: hypothetical protein CSA09_01900 [Candidatus Contendobacter odensis]
MSIEPLYVTAFLLGLTGGVHCFGMCGGIVGALTMGLSPASVHPLQSRLPYLLAYNLGRISSYVIAGLLAGGLGAWVTAHLTSVQHAQLILQVLAGLFMILLGLYLDGWWTGLAHLERIGGIVLWQHIEPLGRCLLPIRTPTQALGIGLVWGWLPCGLVYSVLVWAISAGSAAKGGLLMLGFGLGTLPALLAMGLFAATITRLIQHPAMRHLAGLLVIFFGFYQIGTAI